MPAAKTARTYRFSADTIRRINDVAERQGGLTDTRVIEWAVERLHEDVMAEPYRHPRKRSVKPAKPS